MNKQVIIDEIRRIAESDGGIAPGRDKFEKETGIRESKWRGIYWLKWSEAIVEAGYSPREFQAAYAKDLVLSKLAGLIRKKERFPTSTEIRMEKQIDPEFPWDSVIRRLGAKATLIRLVRDFCQDRDEFRDIVEFLPVSPEIHDGKSANYSHKSELDGSVYLLRSGKFYKIGHTRDMGRRSYDLRIQLPEKGILVHEIRTDDPEGIEQYWHRRYANKRANGEWFSLTQEDITVFRRRKFM
ncbi:GIY-YIG nuclease family protein [Paracidobacterium acidisoli]|uniref:GIY-YIG nuclease family protein n=1 Tax=Paracidobacterium acidisoli TaxID=2303751 RepID=A0A372ISM6_9BACT|nr:GIY-YIG nuclease family protein [Paracidobacterium acidisoli]MBT9330706.1 GIY-YIG nuclease family protein [Paracidobacterium acidisoli]